MKKLVLFVLGVLVGGGALAAVLYTRASALMIEETASPVGVEETVERLKRAAEAEGWKVLGVRKLHESVKEHTGTDVLPVHVVELCHPAHAGRILAEDEARHVSVFMPCSISVYEKKDGKTYLASTNAKLLGRLFGGVVSEVMGGPVSEAQGRFLDAATKR